jgi:hypothetical protein
VKIFSRTIWETGFLPGDERPWAIPWIGDAIVIYYWKDAPKKAGVADPQAAFSNHRSMVETLEKLRKYGFAHPIAVTVNNTYHLLHEASSWIWSAGGNLMNPDHNQVISPKKLPSKGCELLQPASLSIPRSACNRYARNTVRDRPGRRAALSGPWYCVSGC